MICPKCAKTTKHEHLYEAAYGMPETYMVGSEHYRCTECGYCMFREEGEKQDLSYPLERPKRRAFES